MKPTRGKVRPDALASNPSGFLPALRLIAEAGEVTLHLMRRPPDRALEQVPDLVLKDAVGRQANRVTGALGFEELVHLGIGEGRVAWEIKPLHPVSVADDHWLQRCAPAIGAVHVAASQNAPLDIAKLVEYEQRGDAGEVEMAVVGAAFRVAISRAFARIHVEDDGLRRSLPMHLVDPLARQIDESVRFSGRLSHFVSKRPIWLADAAEPMIARSPTTQRIAGSR